MKLISKILIVIGVLFVLNAAGNDDLYGTDYSLSSLFLSVLAGAGLIAGGALILMGFEK